MRPIIWQIGEAEIDWPPEIARQVVIFAKDIPQLCDVNVEERPCICLCTNPDLLYALAGLSCPVWGARFAGLEGYFNGNFADFISAARQPFNPGNWLGQVHLCLPLSYLWSSDYYKYLIGNYCISLELGLDWQALDLILEEHLPKVKDLLASNAISVHMPFMDLHPGSLDAKVNAITSQRLMFAAQSAVELKAKSAVFHLGYDARLNRESDVFVEQVCQTLQPVMQVLQANNCKPVIENVFEPDPDLILAVRERLQALTGQEVGLCLDVGHATAFNQKDLRQWWRAFSPYLAELHLHDNPGDDDLHQAIGTGVIDFKYVGEQLKKQAQLPLLTLEVRSEEALWQSLRTLNQLWGPAPCALN